MQTPESNLSKRLSDIESNIENISGVVQFRQDAKKVYSWIRGLTVFLILSILLAMLVTLLFLSPELRVFLQLWLLETTGSGAIPTAAIAETNPAGNVDISRNFMTLFLAVAAGGIAYLASAMGMRRLEKYDEQFENFREERRKFERRLSEDIAVQIGERLDLEAATSRTEFAKLSEAQISNLGKQIATTRDQLDEKYAILLKDTELTKAVAGDASVGEIHKEVTRAFREDKGDIARKMVSVVLADCDPKTNRPRTTGESNDWFNLGAQLGQKDEFFLALKVSLAGLAQQGTITLDNNFGISGLATKETGGTAWPPNIDLLAHALQYSRKIGNSDVFEKLMELVGNFPKGQRNWRYYFFVGQHYLETNAKEPFFELISEFEETIPNDERSLTLRINWLKMHNQWDQVFDLGREWLDNPNNRGSAVAMTLSDLALDAARYDDVLEYTEAGLEGSAAAQPSVNIAALLFLRANAFDSKTIQELRKTNPDCQRAGQLHANAIRIYRDPSIEGRPDYSNIAKQRILMLNGLMVEKGCLRESEIAQDTNDAKSEHPIQNLLKNFMEADDEGKAKIRELLQGDESTLEQIVAMSTDDDIPEHIREILLSMIT